MLTKEQRTEAARKAIADFQDRMPGINAVLTTDRAIAKAKKEAWIVEHMRIFNVGREKAEKKYRVMRNHGQV